MDRRAFLKTTGIMASQAGAVFAAGARRPRVIPRSVLGRTGVDVPVIGFGGIVVRNTTPKEAARYVEEAIQAGVNYFDVAPTYGDAEEKLGPALKPWRDRSFLACKTHRRDKKGAAEDLHRSLKILQTDHFDLYQLHALTDVQKDVEAALGKGGAMETILEARKQGLVRFIGFRAHSPQAALKAMQEFDFDTVMYPINFACHFRARFETQVLQEARRRNMGIIALKGLARQQWPNAELRKAYPKCWYQPIDDEPTARQALAWTLAQGVNVAIPPGDIRLFRLAVRIAPDLKSPDAESLARLERLARELNPIFGV